MDKVKEKEEWGKESDYLLYHRMNEVINQERYVLWVMTNEEYVKVQLFYNAIKKEFVEIDKIGGFVIKKQREILNFDWPDDTVFNKWREYFVSSKWVETKEEGVG